MSDKTDVSQALQNLDEAAASLAARNSDLTHVDADAGLTNKERYANLVAQAVQVQAGLVAWQTSKKSILKRRPDPSDLVEQAAQLTRMLSQAATATASLAATPGQVLADTASIVSRLSVNEQLIVELEPKGADMTQAKLLVKQLRDLLAQIEKKIGQHDAMGARKLSHPAEQMGVKLSRIVKEQARGVDTLDQDLERAKTLAREVNAKAAKCATVTAQGCPAARESLTDLAQVKTLFEASMKKLAAFTPGIPPRNAVSLLATSLEDLQTCQNTLDTAIERETTRNWAWETCSSMQEDLATIVTELTRKKYKTQGYWNELDTIAGLLASGEVNKAAHLQDHLLGQVLSAYRPALEQHAAAVQEQVPDKPLPLPTRTRPKLAMDPVKERPALPAGTGEEREPVQEEDELVQVFSGTLEEELLPPQTQPPVDVESLRALIGHMSEQIRTLRDQIG